MVDESDLAGEIVQSAHVREAMEELRSFLFQYVYPRSVELSGGVAINDLLTRLFKYYLDHPDSLPGGGGAGTAGEGGEAHEHLVRTVADHIASMTDRFAQRAYFEVFVPRSWSL